MRSASPCCSSFGASASALRDPKGSFELIVATVRKWVDLHELQESTTACSSVIRLRVTQSGWTDQHCCRNAPVRMICAMIGSMNGETAVNPLGNLQKSHGSNEFRVRLLQAPHLSLEHERWPSPGSNDRFCTHEVVLLRRRPSHWQDNCNERTRHRPCNETSLLGASFCPDRDLPGTPCKGAARSEASAAPIHRQLF